jgi:Tfp pilus assembly protein PilF
MSAGNKVETKYRLVGKAQAPRPIRLAAAGWAGSLQKKRVNGSEPQPWHCPVFTEAATFGLELVYQYDTECHIVNEGEEVRIDWNFTQEPNFVPTVDEFTLTAPKPARFYLFATSIDLQAPAEYVLRTEPHPRFFTDRTGTAPLAVSGHIRSEWWAKKLFVAFKAPPPGQRHIFRKGEPYVQILFVPHTARYEPTPMSTEEESARRELERGILLANSLIAGNAWHMSDGLEFNDHYRTLLNVFERGGESAVKDAVGHAVERYRAVVPPGRTMEEYLGLVERYLREGKFLEAKLVLFHTRSLDPTNAEAANRMGVLGWMMGLEELAMGAMQRAIALGPGVAAFQGNLAEMYRLQGRLDEAVTGFRAALQADANDPDLRSKLALALSGKGDKAAALRTCQEAIALAPTWPALHCRMAEIHQRHDEMDLARESYRAALAIKPGFVDAEKGLQGLEQGA